jgi:hypothetical protein
VLALQIIASVLLLGTSVLLLSAVAPSLLGFEALSHKGDLLVVGPVRATELRAGDVIAYRRPESPDSVQVRPVERSERDAAGALNISTTGDPEVLNVAPNLSLGRVAYQLPRVGLLIGMANHPVGKVVLLVCPALLLGADQLRKRLVRTPTELSHAHRVTRLLDSGHRALRAGHADLALRAAHGVLALDSNNTEAASLIQRASGVEHVAA